jgi:hypothetical protein
MKITVHADDGYVTDVVFSKTATSRQLVENFCKKRHPDGAAVNTQELQLAFESEPGAALQLFPQDSIIQDQLKVHENYKKGRMILVGYKANAPAASAPSASQSSAVTVVPKQTVKANGPASKASQGSVADQVRAKTESFFGEVHRLLDNELNRGHPNKSLLLAAKGKFLIMLTYLQREKN